MVIVGGCGHLCLALAFRLPTSGFRVGIYRIDTAKMDGVRAGSSPLNSKVSDELPASVMRTGRLALSNDRTMLRWTETIHHGYRDPDR